MAKSQSLPGMWVEVDGPPTSRSLTTKDGRELTLWSQPALLLEDGSRRSVMFDLSLESRDDAYIEGRRYALTIRHFEKGDYGALTLTRRGPRMVELDGPSAVAAE